MGSAFAKNRVQNNTYNTDEMIAQATATLKNNVQTTDLKIVHTTLKKIAPRNQQVQTRIKSLASVEYIQIQELSGYQTSGTEKKEKEQSRNELKSKQSQRKEQKEKKQSVKEQKGKRSSGNEQEGQDAKEYLIPIEKFVIGTIISCILIALAGFLIWFLRKPHQNSMVPTAFSSSILCPTLVYPGGNLSLAPYNLYKVFIRAGPAVRQGVKSINMAYCGMTRTLTGTCQSAKFQCTIPGPSFRIPVGQTAYIAWINDINSTDIDWPQQDCYANNSSEIFCNVQAKADPKNDACTFENPTYLKYASKSMRINSNNIPINPHIHGLEIRPRQDGNPYSWFSNSGQRGIGYHSYEQLLNTTELKGYKNFKIVLIEANQSPGLYFYHDHAMRSTNFNVKYGLSGIFEIYDPSKQTFLPSANYSNFVLFSTSVISSDPTKHGHHEVIYAINSSSNLERGPTYKFSFLNGHFDNIYRNISFAVYYKNSSGKITYDTNSQGEGKSDNIHLIPFSMIGADSSLFNQPINNLTQFDLGEAQRVQILIQFDSKHGVPAQVNTINLMVYDQNLEKYVKKVSYPLQSQAQNNPIVIDANEALVKINTPYYSLQKVPNSQIPVVRFKGFYSRPSDDKSFNIDGRPMFNMGASDMPQIGTVQDWYIANTMSEAHPLHIHLVNFQNVKRYSLKVSSQGCTLYELDFYRLSGYPAFQSMSNQQLCKHLSQTITQSEADALFKYLSSRYLQNVTNTDSELGKFTGFNVMQKIITNAQKIIYNAQGEGESSCSLNSVYKYICDDVSTSIPEYYKRWKDTSLVEGNTVSVFRVRFAKRDYDPAVQSYPYFNIPEDHLVEFPGYVYHCHILPHEDNEMMRPFMMQHSQTYKQQNGQQASNWTQKASSMNSANQCA